MATAPSRTVRFLAAVGAASLLFASISLAKLIFALHRQSNVAAALLPAPPPDAFANQVFWITGASSGIGKALALHLCKAHSDVKLILSSRRRGVLDEIVEECTSNGRGAVAKTLTVDLADHASLPSKAGEALAMHGGVDVLVNNGGLTTRSMARNSSFDVHSYLSDVNYLSYVALTKALLPSWESRKTKPIIINTSSVAGKLGVPVRTAYCGSKFAIHGWFDAFRIEQMLIDNPVDVLNIVLGSTQTNIARNAATESLGVTFGESDRNIEAGLDPNFVVERVLAAAHAGHEEIWIAPRKELLMLYLNQYIPGLAKAAMLKSVAKQYAIDKRKEAPGGEAARDVEL